VHAETAYDLHALVTGRTVPHGTLRSLTHSGENR